MINSTMKTIGGVKGFRKASVQTTDATETNIKTIPTETNHVYQIHAILSAMSDDGLKSGNANIVGSFRNVAGVLTEITIDTSILFDFPVPWDFQVEINGTNIELNVTGEAGTNINWQLLSIVNSVGA